MALTYYLWRKEPAGITQLDVEEIAHPLDRETSTNPDPNYVVVRQDLDPAVPLTSWKLNAAGNALEDAHAGKSDEERVALNLAESQVLLFRQKKASDRRSIKAACKERLGNIEWKKERAAEEDLLNGNSAAMTAYANEKKVIRDANNDREAALDAIAEGDWAAMAAFDPEDYAGKDPTPNNTSLTSEY
tara:strand:- start:54 stop:617 length:564 start_codon:yes stop_codon:yes gene_type:complete